MIGRLDAVYRPTRLVDQSSGSVQHLSPFSDGSSIPGDMAPWPRNTGRCSREQNHRVTVLRKKVSQGHSEKTAAAGDDDGSCGMVHQMLSLCINEAAENVSFDRRSHLQHLIFAFRHSRAGANPACQTPGPEIERSARRTEITATI